jgi:hypothetical protein
LLLKLRTLIAMYAKFIPIYAVELFVLFPFTGDYLNLEMFKIFYLLGVYLEDVYFCMIFSFSFLFFKRSMQIPIKIQTGSIQDKEIEYFTFIYIHGSWLFILWFHCGFCNKLEALKSLYRSPGYKKNQLVLCKNYVLQW